MTRPFFSAAGVLSAVCALLLGIGSTAPAAAAVVSLAMAEPMNTPFSQSRD